jgi:hypothetical protein
VERQGVRVAVGERAMTLEEVVQGILWEWENNRVKVVVVVSIAAIPNAFGGFEVIFNVRKDRKVDGEGDLIIVKYAPVRVLFLVICLSLVSQRINHTD